MNKPPIINNVQRLREKIQLLELLQEVNYTYKILYSTLADKSIHPYASLYSILKCEIKLVESASQKQQIVECISNTHGPTHDKFKINVLTIYEVSRELENQRFHPFKKLSNHRMLWHGSRITNFIGILTQGLKIAPAEAPSSGFMFGKGIYFADVASKAA